MFVGRNETNEREMPAIFLLRDGNLKAEAGPAPCSEFEKAVSHECGKISITS